MSIPKQYGLVGSVFAFFNWPCVWRKHCAYCQKYRICGHKRWIPFIEPFEEQ